MQPCSILAIFLLLVVLGLQDASAKSQRVKVKPRLSARRRRTTHVYMERSKTPSRHPLLSLRNGHEEPHALHDFDVNDEDALAREVRRLEETSTSDHDDVPTDIDPIDADVAEDWENDYQIMKGVLSDRGFDTSGATKLCELPKVYCDFGYRRRLPTYVQTLAGSDWIGSQYQVVLDTVNETYPSPYPAALFNLRRVNFLSVDVNTGTMPAGASNLPMTAGFWILGSVSLGLEGDLPEDFWNMKTRMFAMSGMPSTFTGSLRPNMGMCDYLDFRFYAYWNPGMTGDIGHLKDCTKLEQVLEIFDTAMYGNAWDMALNLPSVQLVYELSLSSYSGLIPSTTVADSDVERWATWCEQKSELHFVVQQEVNGPLPAGLAACSDKFSYFDVSESNITENFPMNFSNNTVLGSQAIILSNNAFTGQIPEVPPHTTAIGLSGNRWSGDLPASWQQAESLTVLDLSNCQMEGEVPSLTPYIEEVDLSNNRFSGLLPDSWKEAISLETIDLSKNDFTGPVIPWGWQGSDFYSGMSNSLVEVYLDPPSWPLRSITLSDNPMGVSVGFMLGLLAMYSLTEIFLANCSLMGFVSNRDLTPNVPLASGGTSTAGGVHLSKLRTLDISNNPAISSFGYTEAAGDPENCWMSVWDSKLPELSELSFSDCTGLQSLPNKVYTLSTLHLEGATNLQLPEVLTDPEVCNERFGTADPLCDDGKQEACLYLSPIYTSSSGNRECGQLVVEVEAGTHPSVQVDPSSFAPETLCRCKAGYEWEEKGYSCSECPADSYATSAMTECAKCPDNATTGSIAASTSLDACSCFAGFFLSNGICEKCPEGTYSSLEGAHSIDACISCQGGKVTDGKGSNSVEACICPAGLTEEVNGNCVKCAQGRYKTWLGNEECLACPILHGVVQLTTLNTESIKESECVCPAGTYVALGDDSCSACLEGMTCAVPNTTEAALSSSGGYAYPMAASGYMTRTEEPMTVYKCWTTSWCPGGPPGTCSHGRDANAVGCGSCPEGTFMRTNGDCTECDNRLVAVYISIAIAGGIIALSALAFIVNKKTATETKSMTNVLIVAALTLTAVQSMGVLSSLAVVWVEPVRSMLKVFTMMSFDLNVVQAECMIGQTPARSYGIRQLIAPMSCVYIVAIISIRSQFYEKVRVDVECVNAVGAVFQAFFVSILVSITLPFVCYSHPGDVGASMTSDPSIMCFSDPEHSLMIVVGCLSFLLVAAPFIALVGYATCRYRRSVSDSNTASRHLSLFRFLFFRYKPEVYYYSSLSLTRSCMICLLPALIRDAVAAQIVVLAMVLLFFLVLQLYLQPWRSDSANIVDASLSAFLIVILVSVSLVGDYGDAELVAGVSGTVVLLGLFSLSLVAVGHGVYKRLIPTPFFQKFVCHHKADAAAQARYLQMIISSRLHETCFIDSDHLSNLDDLLDVVRCKIGLLVVYCTSETLRRPWCAAEVTTAALTHRRVARIMTPSFCPPSSSEISEHNISNYIQQSDVSLDGLGIDPVSMARAFEWTLESLEVPEVVLSSQLQGLSKFQQVVDDLAKCGTISMTRLALSRSPTSPTSPLSPRPSPTPTTKVTTWVSDSSGARSERNHSDLGENMLIISSDPLDDEATAAAGIVAGKIGVAIVEHYKQGMSLLANLADPGGDAALEAVSSAKAVIIVLSKGSLHSPAQLSAIFTAVHIADTAHTLKVIPVFTPDFRFADSKSRVDHKAMEDGIDANELLHSLFKRIAIGIATHASDSVLDAQCKDIAHRLPRERPSEHRKVSTDGKFRPKLSVIRASNRSSTTSSRSDAVLLDMGDEGSVCSV